MSWVHALEVSRSLVDALEVSRSLVDALEVASCYTQVTLLK